MSFRVDASQILQDARAAGTDVDALVAMRCDECGVLSVRSVGAALVVAAERPETVDQQHGHHVHPGDPDADWICYGHPVEVEHDEAVAAFKTRSVYGLVDLQPAADDLVVVASCAREDRRAIVATGDIAKVAAAIRVAEDAGGVKSVADVIAAVAEVSAPAQAEVAP